MKTQKRSADVIVENLGSITLLQPLSARGWAWVRENLQFESWQVMCGGIAIEHRMLQDITDGMRASELVVN